MRRLIRADIRRILKKRSVIILFFLMLLYLCLIVIGSYPAFDQDALVPVKELMSHTRMPELVLGLVILFGVYADDFRSMTYTCVIGRGLTRSKLVLAKLLDTVILLDLDPGGSFAQRPRKQEQGCRYHEDRRKGRDSFFHFSSLQAGRAVMPAET